MQWSGLWLRVYFVCLVGRLVRLKNGSRNNLIIQFHVSCAGMRAEVAYARATNCNFRTFCYGKFITTIGGGLAGGWRVAKLLRYTLYALKGITSERTLDARILQLDTMAVTLEWHNTADIVNVNTKRIRLIQEAFLKCAFCERHNLKQDLCNWDIAVYCLSLYMCAVCSFVYVEWRKYRLHFTSKWFFRRATTPAPNKSHFL